MKSRYSKELRRLRVGYVPMGLDFRQPGDRRRFVFYAKARGIPFEIADLSKRYDAVVLSQNADLSIWSRYDLGGTKVVFDFIDSYLAIPRTSIKGWMRGSAKYLAGQSQYLKFDHWKALGEMCRRADAVVCSTEEQAIDISRFCQNIHIVLDIHMEVSRQIKSDYAAHNPFRLVWEGLPQNLESLKLLSPVLAELNKYYSFELHVVTDSNFKRYLGKYWTVDSYKIINNIGVPCVFHEWQEATCAKIICASDLAVIPINLKNPFATGKPVNKLLFFWRMGVPVITSATPSYSRAMSSAGLDYAVNGAENWVEKVSSLIDDEALRKRAALLGKAHADCHYSPDATLARWDRVFETLGFSIC